MKDFITKLKKFESLFMYEFGTYDKINNKLKIYLISPDQRHQYISVELSNLNSDDYECEIGDLHFINNKVFEDTPISIFNLTKDNRREYQKYHEKKNKWDNRDIPFIVKSFSTIDLII